MVFALGKSSGAHFNPAVTVALLAAGKFPLSEVIPYMASQFAGGLLAAILTMALYLGNTVPVAPVGDATWWQAALVELFYTLVLTFVVLNVAASKRHAGRSQFYGLAIGFVIAAGAYGAGRISGGCFNPAVALSLDVGSAITSGTAPRWYFLVYMLVELMGGVLAAGLYRVVRPEDYDDSKTGDEPPSMVSKLLSEFVGTYVLVLTVSLNVLTGSPAGAFSIAASLMIMIFALGTVSGAHLNPAVTAAILMSGRNKITLPEVGQYWAVQSIAGVLAGRSAWLFTGFQSFDSLKPSESGWVEALVAEVFFTTTLAFVVLSVATVKNPLSEFFGFSIGMCVTVGGCAIGSISGGSLNPAVSMGIAFSSSGSNIWEFIPYGLVELASGGLAVALFKVTQPSEYEDPLAKLAAEAAAEAAVQSKMEVGLDDINLKEVGESKDFGADWAPKGGDAIAAKGKLPSAPQKGQVARVTSLCRCFGFA
jgi:aquaporin Z